MRGKPMIMVRLDPDVLQKVKDRSTEATRGSSGGVSEYVRALIYKDLGIPAPSPKRKKRNRKRPESYAVLCGEAAIEFARKNNVAVNLYETDSEPPQFGLSPSEGCKYLDRVWVRAL